MEVWRARDADVAAVQTARCGDPFAVLGPHETPVGWVIRVFAPETLRVRALTRDGKLLAELPRRKDDFFEALIPSLKERPSYMLEIETASGTFTSLDPYAFGPALGPLDDHLLREGSHRQLYRRLGAQLTVHEGVAGVLFALWAPNATRASVVGDFNRWDGRRCQMRKRVDSGIWELFVPELKAGAVYKYELAGPDGALLPLKADPFGFEAELRPSTASVVADSADFVWTDGEYMANRGQGEPRRKPMSIYEVHLGSWRRHPDGSFLTYDELAGQLIPYATEMGYTHLELLPISEHPLDEVLGLPADRPVRAELGASASRPASPALSIARMPRGSVSSSTGPRRISPSMSTAWPASTAPRSTSTPIPGRASIRTGTRQSTISAGTRWRISSIATRSTGSTVSTSTACASMPSPQCSTSTIPDAKASGSPTRTAAGRTARRSPFCAGPTNSSTVSSVERSPSPRNSTAFPGVSRPTDHGGLGFGFKWNMGWMHDTLDYISSDPIYRRWSHDKMTFGLLYAYSENFVLPISHDEVVHGKASVVSKMPGDEWRRFANARAFYGLMWGYPGKKLLFMGQEFGQTSEWNASESLPWWLLEYWPHRGVQALIRDLNRLYRETPALHARDCEPEGFRWIVVNDDAQSVLAFLRRGARNDPPVAVVCNFTPVPRLNYRIGLPFEGQWREALNSDAAAYGGSNMGNFGAVFAEARPSHGFPASTTLTLPPLSTLYLAFSPPGAEEAAR